MALTVTIQKKDVKGSEQYRAGVLNLGVYATSGFTITKALMGLNSLHRVYVQAIGDDGTTRRAFVVNPSTNVITAYVMAGTQVTNSTDISTTVLAFEAWGR